MNYSKTIKSSKMNECRRVTFGYLPVRNNSINEQQRESGYYPIQDRQQRESGYYPIQDRQQRESGYLPVKDTPINKRLRKSGYPKAAMLYLANEFDPIGEVLKKKMNELLLISGYLPL